MRLSGQGRVSAGQRTARIGQGAPSRSSNKLLSKETLTMKRTLCSVLSAALALAVLIPMARAGDEDRDHHDGVRQALQALQAQVEALQKQVGDLQTSNAALQKQLTNAKNVLALAPFVSVDPNPQIGVAGPNITFKG